MARLMLLQLSELMPEAWHRRIEEPIRAKERRAEVLCIHSL